LESRWFLSVWFFVRLQPQFLDWNYYSSQLHRRHDGKKSRQRAGIGEREDGARDFQFIGWLRVQRIGRLRIGQKNTCR